MHILYNCKISNSLNTIQYNTIQYNSTLAIHYYKLSEYCISPESTYIHTDWHIAAVSALPDYPPLLLPDKITFHCSYLRSKIRYYNRRGSQQ